MGEVVVVEEGAEVSIYVGAVALVGEYGPRRGWDGVGGEVDGPVLVEAAVAQHGLLYAVEETVHLDGINAGLVGH